METLKLFIKSALIDNVVFIQYLAICPFIGMTNDTERQPEWVLQLPS